MAFHIQESFEVAAPVERVWPFLIDPRRVVECLPGADVTEVVDEQTYAGSVRVKVGPVTATYKGTVRLEEADEATRIVRLKGEGKESGGAGSARMSMTGRLSAADTGKTQVRFDAEIDVAGKMARFGRGVMEDVSRQIFREFAKNTQERLRTSPGDAIESDAQPDPEQIPSTQTGSQANDSDAPVAADRNEEVQAPKALNVPGLVARAIWSRVRRLFGS